ncbi:MAG: HPr family phosphocarrier protein [Geminicoccaceae bacterium]|nr:HPr family phosphocarrier protein [Geminicoccaceae bacterium]
MSAATRTVRITHKVGLHARPAVALMKRAKSFESALTVRGLPDGAPVDAKSIVKVLGLKLKTGTLLEITAEGDDAQEAVAALADLVVRDFAEEPDAADG